jgi:hypothetical protein
MSWNISMERTNTFLALIVINFGVADKCMKHGKLMLRTKPVHNIKFCVAYQSTMCFDLGSMYKRAWRIVMR